MFFREGTDTGAAGIKREDYSIPVTASNGTSRIGDDATIDELADRLTNMAPQSAVAIGLDDPLTYVLRVSKRTYNLGAMIRGKILPLPASTGDMLVKDFEAMIPGSYFRYYKHPRNVKI